MKKILAVVASFTLALCAFAFAGCGSSNHEAVDSATGCVDCHSDGRALTDTILNSSSNTVSSKDGKIAVKVSGASKFYVCEPRACDNGSSTPIPLIVNTCTVSDGEDCELTLEEGTWMLVAQAEGKVVSQMVNVGPDEDGENISVSLSL